uniref:PHD and RING finger domain-containing protein 1 n=1 Tax=Nelumbo nucifera TaxID=4432 RepID=A0A822YJS5_NELNU|nr:TPA_asm: hypothetical protein HUJ06_010410 [Nelumbo nucifera]
MDSVSDVCGICLSDDGKAIRGWIDSCNHYFCFVCIMEWSKVESLCPMCKQRFSTIRRPPKEGVFLSERIVNVPVRNQVYHPLGNSMIGPSDPYAEVRCTECHSTADENLLLLCDLCDSAAHTYCVGLGVTVPEGDWYCHDCAVSRDDHSNSQTDIDGCNQNFSKSFGTKVAETHVSIFDIVRESDTPEGDVSPSIVTQRGTCSASRVRETCIAQRDTSAASRVSDATVTQRDTSAASRVRDTSAASRVSDPSARTLRRCRNVQVRIQALRENWSALRSGSVRFSSSLLDSCGKRNTKNSNGAIISDRLSLSRSSPSMSSQQITSMDSVSGDTFSSRGSYDIDRAWKMLDIAKSLQRAPKGTHNDHQDSTYPFTKRHSPKEANNITSTFSVPKNKAFTGTDLGNVKIEKSYNCRTSEKEKPSKETIKERVKVNASQKHGGKIEQPCFSGGLTNSKDGTDGSACPITLVNSAPGCSEVSCGRPEFGVSLLSKVGTPIGRGELEKELAEGTTRKDDAKSEVQSLVKLNLKLLNRDKKLGMVFDSFFFYQYGF